MKISILLLVLTFSLSLFAQSEKLDIKNPKDDKELGVIKTEMKNLKSELKNLPSFQPSSVKGGDQLMVCFPDIKKNIAEVDTCLKTKYDYYQEEINKAEKIVSDWETEQGAKMKTYEAQFATNTKQIDALKNVKVQGIGKNSIKESIEKIKSEMTNSKRLYDEDLAHSRNAMKAKVYGIVNSGLSDVLKDSFSGIPTLITEEMKAIDSSGMIGLDNKLLIAQNFRVHYRPIHFLNGNQLLEVKKLFNLSESEFRDLSAIRQNWRNSQTADTDGERFIQQVIKKRMSEYQKINRYISPTLEACAKDSPSRNCKSSLCTSMVNEYISTSYKRLGTNSKKVYALFKFEDKNKVDELVSTANARIAQKTQEDGAGLPPADFAKLVTDCDGSQQDKINIDNGLRGEKKEAVPTKNAPKKADNNSNQQ